MTSSNRPYRNHCLYSFYDTHSYAVMDLLLDLPAEGQLPVAARALHQSVPRALGLRRKIVPLVLRLHQDRYQGMHCSQHGDFLAAGVCFCISDVSCGCLFLHLGCHMRPCSGRVATRVLFYESLPPPPPMKLPRRTGPFNGKKKEVLYKRSITIFELHIIIISIWQYV